MSNQPLRENLLSGYLDNQLSPELRAEVETELEKNGDLKALFEILQRQSLQCASIPKYRLDTGFADRVLSDPRSEAAFSAMGDRHQVAGGDVAYRSGTHSLRSAAIAILSLAALVLITLFLQNPERGYEVRVLSKSAGSKSTTDSEPNKKGVASNLSVDKSPDFDRPAFEVVPGKSDNVLGEQDFETDLPSKAGSESKQILAADIEGMKKESVAGDVLNTMRQEPVPSQMVEANSPEPENNFQLTDKPKSGSESFGKGGVALVQSKSADELPMDSVSNAARNAAVQSVPPSLGQIATSQSIANNPADSLNGFIEIKYTGGPEKLVDFKSALSRNQIVINVPAHVEGGQLNQLDRSAATNEKSSGMIDGPGIGSIGDKAGGGGMGGEAGISGLGGRSGDYESQTLESMQRRQAGSRNLGNAIAPAPDSQLFLITATPQQMVGLIEDLRSTSTISGYQMPELKPQAMFVQPPGPALQFDDGRSNADQETALNSDLDLQQARPVTAGEGLDRRKDESQSAARKRSESVPGGDKQLGVQAGLDGASLGVALTVKRQIELRGEPQEQSIPGVSRESKIAARDNGLKSSQKANDQADVDALYRYFATQAGEFKERRRNSPVRQYLLFVHAQNAAVDGDPQSESEIAKPVPADASELKK